MATRTIVEARRNPDQNSVYPVEFSPGVIELNDIFPGDYRGLAYNQVEPQTRRWYCVFEMAEAICKKFEKKPSGYVNWNYFDCEWM